MPAAPTADFTPYLSHADAGVRGRAWAWQSALSLLLAEGGAPSAYLLETACRHIEGCIPMALVAQLVELYLRTQPSGGKGRAATGAADLRALELARMLGEAHEQASRAQLASIPPPAASPWKEAPAEAGEEADEDASEDASPASEPALRQPASATELAPGAASVSSSLRRKRLLRTFGKKTLGIPELLKALRLNNRQSFMLAWLNPAMAEGLVRPLYPESPRHPRQKYLLTKKGLDLAARLVRK